MGDSFAADQVINSLNDFSQEPGIPTCPLQGVVSWKILSPFSKRTFFGCLLGTDQESHSGRTLPEETWLQLTQPSLDWGQFLNEITEPLQGLCKTFKGELFPEHRPGLRNAKFAGWIQTSPSRCDKCKCSQIVDEAMTNSHFIHPESQPRVKRFTSSCISVMRKCRPPLRKEPGHDIKVEMHCYLNGVEVIIITIIVITNIYQAHTLCQVL